jgi:hypothetical protein
MKRKGGGFEPSYNPQITVDAHSQVVLAADVTVDRNDCAQLTPQLDQAGENTGGRPGQVSADNGYFSGPNLASLEQREVRGYIPPSEDTNQRGKDGAPVLSRNDFHYDRQHDRFICPAGQELSYSQTKVKHQSTGSFRTRVYKKKNCAGCPLATRCLQPDSTTRSIEVSEHQGLVLAMRERMSSDEGKAAYALRRQSAEPVFGIVKWPMAFRSFLLRGLKKVRSEWRLALAAFNIRKIWKSGALSTIAA